MKITRVETWRESVALARPYTITRRTVSAVELFFVRLESDGGAVGLGSAAPAESVSGADADAACGAALASERLEFLVGRDPRHLGALCRLAEAELGAEPAAHAAVDTALHDLFARLLDVPLVDLLGRCHRALPTSVTVGIQGVDATLAEAEELLSQGFRCLKVKVGRSFAEDLERLHKLREHFGPGVTIRIDGNQGYDAAETARLEPLLTALDLELVEQPLPAAAVEEQRQLPAALKRRLAVDEGLLDDRDALALVRPPVACGIFNVKLMKCGGVRPALRIAAVAEAAGVELMWGCMDESVISITAALHAAYASPPTRYLDLDGSFDLARDPAAGGFRVVDGFLHLLDAPGLGVELRDDGAGKAWRRAG